MWRSSSPGWADSILSKLDDEQIQRMLNTEFGGMNEVAADLYADTGDARWLTLSDKFEQRSFVDPLAQGEDILGGKHGNTNVPKMIGELARYIYTGNETDGKAATYFWDQVALHHSFATGGYGRNEYFGPADQLNDLVDGRTAETCNVYNMIKMSRTLFSVQPEIRYADFHERALVQSHSGVAGSGRRARLLHGAGGPRRAARISGQIRGFHVLRGHRDGEPCAARVRNLLRVGRQAVGEPVCAYDCELEVGRRAGGDEDGFSGGRDGVAEESRQTRRRNSRWRCGVRIGRARDFR